MGIAISRGGDLQTEHLPTADAPMNFLLCQKCVRNASLAAKKGYVLSESRVPEWV